MTKKWDRLFPFDRDGVLLSYAGSSEPADRITLDAARFTGVLTYAGYSRGRSSALLRFTDGVPVAFLPDSPDPKQHWRSRPFYFFMSDADTILPRLERGRIRGTFVPTKRGQNFGWKIEE